MKIQIHRKVTYADRLRDYKVVLDGKIIGSIGSGEIKEFETGNGKHALVIKIDWCRSNVMHFNSEERKLIKFDCISNLTGSKVFLAIFYVIFMPYRYIKLTRAN